MSVLFLTGPSGTGKTTLATSLQGRHGGEFISERKICHDLANSYGFPRTRYWLEAVGTVQVGQELSAHTSRLVCAGYAGKLMVVDGVYQPQLVRQIAKAQPDIQRIVAFVNAPEHVRLQQVAKRHGVGLEQARKEMDFLDSVKSDFGMADMLPITDIVLDGSQNTDVLQAQIEELLGLPAPTGTPMPAA